MRRVVLSEAEILHAALNGVRRTISALKLGRRLEAGRNGRAWRQDIIGSIGEYAWAVAEDKCWRPLIGELDTARGDVDGVQVRATENPNGCLIIRPEDAVEASWALAVLDKLPEVRLFGPIIGYDGKQACYWRERDPARGIHKAGFFVPQAVVDRELF